jgi:hypothetical protein
MIRGSRDCFGEGALTSVVLFLLGLGASLVGNAGWIHLGEYQPWLPIARLEYGFPIGVIFGIIVALRKSTAANIQGTE